MSSQERLAMSDRMNVAGIPEVKASLVSPETCHQDTVVLVAKLLDFRLSGSQRWSQRPAKTENVHLERKRSNRSNSARKTPKPEAIRSVKALEPVERLRFAVEVANSALKSLTKAVRDEHKPLNDPGKPVTSDENQHELDQSIERRQTGLRSLSQCASLAFSAIRHARLAAKIGAYQAESGMSSLIGKMIALNQLDLAAREIGFLSDALLSIDGVETWQTDEKPMHKGMLDLLCKGQLPSTNEATILLITTHVHALKLLAVSSIEDHDGILKSIGFHKTSRTNSLIMDAQHQNLITVEAAFKQLESLSRALHDLSNSSRESSTLHGQNKNQMSAFQTLQYRLFAHKAKLDAWTTLNKPRSTFGEDIARPLFKSLRSFARSSEKISKEQYLSVGSYVQEQILPLISWHGSPGSFSSEQVRSSLRKDLEMLLHQIAATAQVDISSCPENMALKPSFTQSESSHIGEVQRLAELIAASMRSDAKLSRHTSAELLNLCSQLQVLKASNTSEGEEIFISLSTIRRISHKHLRHYADSVSTPTVGTEQYDLAGYIKILLVVPRYLCSYADHLERTGDKRSQQIFEHRVNMLERVALPSIDAVLLAAKTVMCEDETSVRLCFDAIDHYVQLIKILQRAQSKDTSNFVNEVLRKISPHASDVMVSMFFYFNNQKVAVIDPMTILQSSVDVLHPLTVEQRAQANFHGKVERLSRELAQRSRNQESLIRLEEALASHAHALTKRDIQDYGLRSHVQRELHFDDASLRKMMAGHLKMAINVNAEPLFMVLRFSELSYPEYLTDFMQECQLLEILSLVQQEEIRSLDLLQKCIQFFDTDICRSKPTKARLRWLGIVLHFAVLRGVGDAMQSQKALAEIFNEALTQLDGVSENTGYLVASCQVGLFLLSGSTESVTIMAALNRWDQEMGQMAPATRLVEHHPSADQIELLEILEEYLEYHKMSQPHLYCLELMTRSHRPINSVRPARELELRYRLATQYLNSGLVDQANATVNGLSNYYRDYESDGLMAMKVRVLQLICSMKLGLSEKSIILMQQWCAAVEDFPATQYRKSKDLTAFADLIQAISVIKQESLQGDEALYYAKYNAKLSLTIMSSEKASLLASRSPYYHSHAESSSLPKGTPPIKSPDRVHLLGFWRFGSMLKTANRVSSALIRLSTCLANAGQVQDALQYLNQATSVAVRARLPLVSKRAGLFRICLETLRLSAYPEIETESRGSNLNTNVDASEIEMMLTLCSSQIMIKNHQYTELLIHQIAVALETPQGTEMKSPTGTVDTLQHEIESMTLGDRVQTRAQSKRMTVMKPNESHDLPGLSTDMIVRKVADQFELRNQLVIRQAALACDYGNPELAIDILNKLDERMLSHNDTADKRIIEARAAYKIATEIQVLNPIYGGLTEVPLVVPGPKSKGHLTTVPGVSRKRRGALSKSRSKGAQDAVKSKFLTKAKISELLQRGEKALKDALLHCHDGSPTYRSHQISNSLCTISILLCTIDGVATSQTSVYGIIAHLELGRNLAWQRMINNLAAEHQLQNLNEYDIRAPQMPGTSGLIEKTSVEFFTQRYLGIIPESWIIIGLSLSEDKRDLQLSRLRRESEPFVVSIPLNRSAEGIGKVGAFAFSDCMQELGEIVSAANSSTENAAVPKKKGAKREWWQRRAQLDQRMKELLVSIEELWLGGFRGIFHQHEIDKPAFDTLYQKVDAILNKHLPSRSLHAKKQDGDHMALRPSIVELFVGLGSPDEDEEGSLDDSLLDLWTFVVDVFRFQGELNAHDEIDFDAMIIDVSIALKQYHVSSSNCSDTKCKPHTILILDRHLHSVPWESLPCLHGISISRLPSLEAMRNILIRPEAEAAVSAGSSAVIINRCSGAYVLNPASDLSHTEDVFMPSLTKLPLTWQGLVRVVPEEAQLEEFLLTRDVYLYLGHGSGAQFIRGKAIRKLQRCAVALLMGCSSVTMSEAGCFESSGVPLNYLLAGAPAVVGTLWDVTDKDIDRFSMQMLEGWGLFQTEASSPTEPNARAKQPGIQCESRDDDAETCGLPGPDDQRLSLDEAVAGARNACIMRYLNGAAPVVYGVPVSLGEAM